MTGEGRSLPPGLGELARLHGIQTAFRDTEGRLVRAPAETLVAVLRALGVPVEGATDVAQALAASRHAEESESLAPVTVLWSGRPRRLAVRPPPRIRRVEWEVVREDGARLEGGALLPAAAIGPPGSPRWLALPRLPNGYHTLRLAARGLEATGLLIVAPRRAYVPPGLESQPSWGAFLPLYALRSPRGMGTADFRDLEALMEWTRARGGSAVGILPVLAAFLSQPFEPSPYAPASRLFWNELFVDLDAAAAEAGCAAATELAAGAEFQAAAALLREAELIDYASVAKLKRAVMQRLADCAFDRPSEDLASYLDRNRDVLDYARFRAVGEQEGAGWPAWPERRRAGDVREDDFDAAAVRYHAYGQWQADLQLRRLADRAREAGVHLYLDYPLGVHPDSYDRWRHRDLFADGFSAGAPPDTFFRGGQDWGFPPLNPFALRRDGYARWRRWLSHHMEVADILRIDHVMGLHRLFWIPSGKPAAAGAYVRYPAEELYAIVTLESHRHRTLVVGEDLGTVPGYVRAAMRRHGLNQTYVLQLEAPEEPDRDLSMPPPASVASLNTHDLAPFAAFWRGADIEERFALGHVDASGVAAERGQRERKRQALVAGLRRRGLLDPDKEDEGSVLYACLAFLAGSPARMVFVNLEDLWLETEPQNVPGTSSERPNWRRRARLTLEEIDQDERVRSLLGALER